MNPLPPQAYTKDTMLKAYAWLMNQPQNIKELATTPDILVSLFLKTQRDGLESLERPSIQNFRNELKSLAGMMDGLERNDMAQQHIEAPPTTSHQQNNRTSPNPQPHVTSTESHVEFSKKNFETSKLNLDDESLKMIHEVKEGLNLSSDVEAIRALIKIGFSSISKVLE